MSRFLFKLNLSEENLKKFYACSPGQNMFCTQSITALSLSNFRLMEVRILALLNFARTVEQPIFKGYNTFCLD